MPVKVIDGNWDLVFNSPFVGTDDVVARGVRYAVDNGAKVVNMSIGRSGPPAPVVRGRHPLRRVAGRVRRRGRRATNSCDGNRLAAAARSSRRSIDGMVAVGAVGRDKQRAVYSSIGLVHRADRTRRRLHPRRRHLRRILQQTYDLDLVETYTGSVGRYRAPRFDVVRLLLLHGHVDGDAARGRASRRC